MSQDLQKMILRVASKNTTFRRRMIRALIATMTDYSTEASEQLSDDTGDLGNLLLSIRADLIQISRQRDLRQTNPELYERVTRSIEAFGMGVKLLGRERDEFFSAREALAVAQAKMQLAASKVQRVVSSWPEMLERAQSELEDLQDRILQDQLKQAKELAKKILD